MRSLGFFFGVLFFLFPSLAFFAWGASRNSRIRSSTPWVSQAGTPAPLDEMPVWQLGWYAMKMPFEKIAIFLRMAIVPLAISIALSLPSVFLHRSPAAAVANVAQRSGVGSIVLIVIALAVNLVIQIPFQVGWLRFVVLGDSSARGRGYFRFDETEKRYLGYVMLLLAAFLPAGLSLVWFHRFPQGSAGSAGAALVFLGLLCLTAMTLARLVFVLPEVATGRFESIFVSWQRTGSIGLRLLCVVATAALPLLMASAVLLEFGTANGFVTRIGAMAGSVFLDYAGRAAFLAAVAIAYRDWGIEVNGADRATAATVA